MNGDDDVVDVKTGPVGLHMAGRTAFVMFLVLAIMADSALTYWEHSTRAREHADLAKEVHEEANQIVCALRLNLYFYSLTKGEPINWNNMPNEVWPCIPKFIYDRK